MPVQKLYFQSYDGRFGLPKGDVKTNVLSEDVCLARKSEMNLAHRRWDHYPKKKVSTSLPFVDIGNDFAGPLYVKQDSSVKKAYVGSFTCAPSRIVHLEL